MKRTFAAAVLVAGLLPFAVGPVAADTGWNRAPTTAQRGVLCQTGVSCPSVYHTRRGVHKRIVVNCGTYENPKGNRYLARGQSSKDAGKCGKKTNAVWVPRGFDLVRCSRATPMHPLQCYPVYKAHGWHYLGDLQHLRAHLVHNGVCVQECEPGDA